MDSESIKKSFIKFFENKNHIYIPPLSLIPPKNTNLLFTNAGMNQFIDYFLSNKKPKNTKVVNIQRCVRAGGKHNDIKDVGFDGTHHTSFEMLGNWSFGDYFKKEAIEFAWEFLTKILNFPPNRLYVTVYKPSKIFLKKLEDKESYLIWKNIFIKEKIDPEIHIKFFDEKDNFWSMGDEGPCGPCTEIHVDLTNNGNSKGELVNKNHPYCIEIWNIVFIQFNMLKNKKLINLPLNHIDTGMGLERICGILSSTNNFKYFGDIPNNYSSDLFKNIINIISNISNIEYKNTFSINKNKMSEQEIIDTNFRIIADHIKTIVFMISDNILPSNEGRGYVLKKIIRKAIISAITLKLNEKFLSRLFIKLIENKFFKDIKVINSYNQIKEIIINEEKKFYETMLFGKNLINKKIINKNFISGKDAFYFYETYGIPIEITEVIAKKNNIIINYKEFEEVIAKNSIETKKRSLIDKKFLNKSVKEIKNFIGYNHKYITNYETIIVKQLILDNKIFIILKKTPFYPQMSGQIGDTGFIFIKDLNIKLAIINTEKDDHGNILHEIENSLKDNIINKEVIVSVDKEKRKSIERNHTSTHLLQWSLRQVLGDNIHQSGSLITDQKLRFDFNYKNSINQNELDKIENIIQKIIMHNHKILKYKCSIKEIPNNCLSLFTEKYSDKVRVININNESIELCSGTHVEYTGEISCFKILSEYSISKNTRRIEAISGEKAFELFQNNFTNINFIFKKLKITNQNSIKDSFNNLLLEKKLLEDKILYLEKKEINFLIKDLEKNIIYDKNKDLKILVDLIKIENNLLLKEISLKLFKNLTNDLIILGNLNNKFILSIFVICSNKSIEKGFFANIIIDKIIKIFNGKGGGKKDFANGACQLNKDINIDFFKKSIWNLLN